MRIPTEHFSNVPVVLLSPSLMSSPEDDPKDSFPRSLVSRLMVPESSSNAVRNSVGSAPSSPNLHRGMTVSSSSAPGSRVESSMSCSVDGPASLQPVSPASTISDRRYVVTLRCHKYKNMYQQSCSNWLCYNTTMFKFSVLLIIITLLAVSLHMYVLVLFYLYRTRMSRARTLGRGGDTKPADRLKGMQMIVCHDCKIMVIQIIKSSRTSRSAIRNNAIRNLTLNLSPVY